MFEVKLTTPEEVKNSVFKAADKIRQEGSSINVSRISRMVGQSGETILPYLNEWRSNNGLSVAKLRKSQSNQHRVSRPTATTALDKTAIFRAADSLKSRNLIVTAQAVGVEIGSSRLSQIETLLKDWFEQEKKRNVLRVVDISNHGQMPYELLKQTRELSVKLGWEPQKLDSILTKMKRSEYKTVVEIFEKTFEDVVCVVGKPWKTYSN